MFSGELLQNGKRLLPFVRCKRRTEMAPFVFLQTEMENRLCFPWSAKEKQWSTIAVSANVSIYASFLSLPFPPPAESFPAVPDVELHVCLMFDLSIRSGAERRKQKSFRGRRGGHGQSFRRVAPEVGLPATRHLLPAPPPPAGGAGSRGGSPPALS